MAAPVIYSTSMPPQGTSGQTAPGWVVADQPIAAVEFSEFVASGETQWVAELQIAGGELSGGSVGDATPLNHRDLVLSRTASAPLLPGQYAPLVRVSNAAGEWSDFANLLFDVFVDQLATDVLELEVEQSPGVFDTSTSSLTGNSPSSTEPSGAVTFQLQAPAVDRGSGEYSAAVRVGGLSGTVHEGPRTASTGDWRAIVRATEAGVVQWVAWASTPSVSANGQDAAGRVVAVVNATADLYNADGSLAFTSPNRSVALLDAEGTWLWVQSFTEGSSFTTAVTTGGLVVGFTMPAATLTYETVDGSWTYTKPSAHTGAMLLWLNPATGAVEWSQAARTNRTEFPSLSLSVAPNGRAAAFLVLGATTGNVTYTFGGITASGPPTSGLVFSSLPFASGEWAGIGPTRAQFSGTWVSAQSDVVYVAHEAGFVSGSWTSDWGPFSVTGSGRSTLLGAIDANAGALIWYQQPIPDVGDYSLVYSRLPGSTTTGAWVSQNTRPPGSTARNDIALVDPAGTTLAFLSQTPSSTSTPHASVAPTSDVNAYAVLYSNGPTNLVNGDGVVAESLSSGQYLTLLTAGGGGTWSQLGGAGGPNAITAPASLDWPPTIDEDGFISASLDGLDLRDPAVEGADIVLQVLDPATGTWVEPTTEEPLTLAGGVGPGSYGNALVTIAQASTAEFLLASALVIPDADYNGDVRVFTRWFDKSTGQASAVSRFATVVSPLSDAPSALEGAMPDTVEDVATVGTFTWIDPDNVGAYTVQLSPQTEAPEGWDPDVDGDFHTTTGTTITVIDDGDAVGTATVLSIDASARSASVRFTPVAHWNGSPSFALRVSNGEWSSWITTSLTVSPLPDAPSEVIGELPALNEDGSATFTLTWTDPDNLDGDFTAAGSYELQLGLSTSGPWTNTGSIDVPGATITVVSYSETTLSAELRADGDANYYGSYEVAVRVHDLGDDLFGPARLLSSTIASVPDIPARVTPSRMPAARHGQNVEQLFSTFDPDPEDAGWTFTVSASPAGPWTGSITLTGVGTIGVFDTDTSDQTAPVRLEQQPGGATVNRYSFYIRATDSSGLSSPPTKVIGYISDPLFQGWLQRIDRTSTTANIVRLSPLLGLTRSTVTDAIAGPGSLELTASATELRRRAEELNLTPAQLVEPGSVEVVVSLGSEPLWVGPITEVRWDAGRDTVDISARGLLSYLDTRTLPTAVTYTAEELSDIVADLVADTQALTYGSLEIVDGTTPTGVDGTLTFDAGTRISDALRDIAEVPGAPEVWIDPERILRAATTRGTDRRSAVRITSGLVEVASWASRDDDIVTVATVNAPDNGSGASTGTYADTTAMAIYGRVERVYEADHLLSNAACAALAEQIVKAHAARAEAIQVRMTLDATRPVSARSLGVGDVVTVDLRDPQLGQVLGAYRIVNRVVELAKASSTAVTVTLDLEPARWVNGVLVGSRTRHNPEVMVRLQEVDVRTR